MTTMTYDRLERVSRSQPPYRGTTNRFPLYTRRQNTKYFFTREEDGQKVFDIVYGQRWDRVAATKEEFDDPAQERTYQSDDGQFWKYVAKPNIVGTVRPGNEERGEFQFDARNYGQGDRSFLGDLFPGWFATDSRRGGMVYRHLNIFHPIYAGMKVHAGSMTPSKRHEVVINHVDRKKSKQLVKDYEHFFSVSEVMLKALTMDMVIKLAAQLMSEVNTYHDQVLLHEARDRINTAPLDAFVLYCMGYHVGSILYEVKFPQRHNWVRNKENRIAYDELFMSVKRRIVKDIYKGNPDVFKEVRYGCGEMYPASDWGTSVLVNGLEMVQYK